MRLENRFDYPIVCLIDLVFDEGPFVAAIIEPDCDRTFVVRQTLAFIHVDKLDSAT